jgi:putative SOS response-associated peptidase YedK
MCGRYNSAASPDEIAAHYGVTNPPVLTPRYNVAPSQVVAVIGLKPDGSTRAVALFKWGLVPSWSNDPDPKVKPINVRAESVMFEFTDHLLHKRALIPATGFYERRAVEGRKRPCHFTMRDGRPFGLAGLWDAWRGDGNDKPLLTCRLITTRANDLVSPVHDRMPVILPPASFAAWLDPETPEARLVCLLRPYPADEMTVTEVGPAVNSPWNDGPVCPDAA